MAVYKIAPYYDICRWVVSIVFLVFFLISTLLPTKSDAAAWLQPKGEGLIIGNIQPYLSCKYWDKQGDLPSGPCFRQFSINPYMEYGLTSNITLIVNPTFNIVFQKNNLEKIPNYLPEIL